MPRLSPKHYLERHDRLRTIWLTDNASYGCLSASEQWILHKYYQPSKSLTSLDLLEHRSGLDKQEPSLGSRAGKQYAKVYAEHVRQQSRMEAVPHGKPQRLRPEDRHLTLRAVAHPEPDLQKLSRAFIGLALARAGKVGHGETEHPGDEDAPT